MPDIQDTKLKFLADVNIERGIIRLLSEYGYDSIWVADVNPAMTDEEILNLARNDRHKLLSNGVILFRTKDLNSQDKSSILENLIPVYLFTEGNMIKENLLERIELNPQIMLGKPVIRGTRLTVEILLEKLAYGQTEEQIFNDYPFLIKEDIQAALLYAARQLSFEEEFVV